MFLASSDLGTMEQLLLPGLSTMVGDPVLVLEGKNTNTPILHGIFGVSTKHRHYGLEINKYNMVLLFTV